jgi:predicted alpha/beta hydrolase family esterase
MTGEKTSAVSSELQAGLYNHIPKENLGYPSILAASLNDPCISFKRATWWATTWRSRLVCLGNQGHVNVASGHGPWPDGLSLFEEITRYAGKNEEIWPMTSQWAY